MKIPTQIQLIIILLLIEIWTPGCSSPKITEKEPEPRGQTAMQDPVLLERKAKDDAFRGDDSPLLPADKASFRGLAYFPVDPNLRFEVRLIRHPVVSAVRLATNTGEIRGGLRYGYFEFQAGGKPCRLQVYRLEDAEGPTLFIPFRDATSGKETYPAGRYIDLNENTSGLYELDFNRAYNPWCAYNNEYSCPVPPPENTLPVSIQAGEKLPSFAGLGVQ